MTTNDPKTLQDVLDSLTPENPIDFKIEMRQHPDCTISPYRLAISSRNNGLRTVFEMCDCPDKSSALNFIEGIFDDLKATS